MVALDEGGEQVLLGGEVVVDGRLANADRLAEMLVAHGVGPQALDQVLGGVEDQAAGVCCAHVTILPVGRYAGKSRSEKRTAHGGTPADSAIGPTLLGTGTEKGTTVEQITTSVVGQRRPPFAHRLIC